MNRDEFLSEHFAKNPYPWLPDKIAIAGRLKKLSIEEGKNIISILRNNKIQNFQIHTENLKNPSILNCIKVNDIIAITEDEIVLLAPALKDVNHHSIPAETLKASNLFLHKVREFFFSQGFIEIKTPTLVICPGTEPSLDVFSTELKFGSKIQKLYLPTSPELHLKKALSRGQEKIFEVATVFRNGEITDIHQPEFLILEWYRAYEDLEKIKYDVLDLVDFVINAFEQNGIEYIKPEGVSEKTIAELFLEHCQFIITPRSTIEDYKKCANLNQVDISSATTIDDIFFLIMMEKIEPKLNKDEITFVKDYPPFQAALARITPEGWGARFEVYWQGMELANAFNELNNPEIQRKRFEEDLLKKKLMRKELVQIDEEFLISLEEGMPPSSGIALGLERLLMVMINVKKISNVKIFPHKIY